MAKIPCQHGSFNPAEMPCPRGCTEKVIIERREIEKRRRKELALRMLGQISLKPIDKRLSVEGRESSPEELAAAMGILLAFQPEDPRRTEAKEPTWPSDHRRPGLSGCGS